MGRPSPEVRPSPSIAALAVYPEIDAVTIGLVNLGGIVQKKIRFATERIPSAREAVNIAAAVIEGMRTELDHSYRITGIGVAVPGLVNPDDGTVAPCAAPGLAERACCPDAQRGHRLRLPGRQRCLARSGGGADLRCRRRAGTTSSTSTAAPAASAAGSFPTACCSAARPAIAGELGHTFVRTSGEHAIAVPPAAWKPRCPRPGSLNCSASSGGDTIPARTGPPRVQQRPGVAEEVSAPARYLGIALRNAVNTFNPEVDRPGRFPGVLTPSRRRR